MIKAEAKMCDDGTVETNAIVEGDSRDIAREMCGILGAVVERLEEAFADGVTTDTVIDSIAEAVKATLNKRGETE